MNSINYTLKAVKQLRKIQQQHATKIVLACNELETMPQCEGVKKLVNHEFQYRLRVGNYRVFFNFDGVVHIVTIQEVKKRDERTY